MLAPLHERQGERLKTLQGFGILDTQREKEFDDVVALVSRLCDVPVALVSLVDKDRQWFKASCGLNMDETSLEQSICSHVILEEGFVEIPDLTQDPRTADNSLVTGPDQFRYYAGMPMIADNGLPIGTLCVLDYKPRRLDPDHVETLRVMAGLVMRQIALHKALEDGEVLRAEIDHRVKNSLQTVLSVARLYRSRIKAPEADAALEAVSRRIEAIAMLHAELYQTSQTDRVQMQSYVERVVSLLQTTTPANLSIRASVGKAEVNSRVAANLGMILSEFVANAIKHAFPDGRAGVVSIDVSQPAHGGPLAVVCADNGVGFETSGNDDAVSSLGVRLMQAAVEQIGGKLTLQSVPGSGSKLSIEVPSGLSTLSGLVRDPAA